MDGSDSELAFCYWNGTTLSRGTNQLFESSTGSVLSLTNVATATLMCSIEELFCNRSGRWAGWNPRTSSATLAESGIGTAATGGPSQVSPLASTSLFTEQVRVSFTSATTANATAGINTNGTTAVVSSSAGRGGWTSFFRWGWTQIPTGMRVGIGMTSATGMGTAQPSAGLNRAMIAKDSTDTNLQFMHNDGSGTCTKVDLGFVPAINQWLNLAIWQNPGSLDVHFLVANRSTGTLFYSKATTNTPATGTLLSSEVFSGLSGTTGTAVILHVGSFDSRMGY